MNTPLKIGVIGLGKMGCLHLQKYLQLPQVTVVGVYDVSPDRTRAVSEQFRVPSKDLSDLLFQVDAVSIATSTEGHYPITLQALRAGVHCLVEKPLTLRVDEALELEKLATENKLILQVGFLERYRFDRLKQYVIPFHPTHVEMRRLSVVEPRENTVNVINDLMIHDLDLLVQIMKETPNDFNTQTFSLSGKRLDSAKVDLNFSSGRSATLQASYIANRPSREVIWQSDGFYCHFDLISELVYQKNAGQRYGIYSMPAKTPIDGIKEECEDFLESIRLARPARVSARDSVETQKLMDEILTSITAPRIKSLPTVAIQLDA